MTGLVTVVTVITPSIWTFSSLGGSANQAKKIHDVRNDHLRRTFDNRHLGVCDLRFQIQHVQHRRPSPDHRHHRRQIRPMLRPRHLTARDCVLYFPTRSRSVPQLPFRLELDDPKLWAHALRVLSASLQDPPGVPRCLWGSAC